MKRLPLVLSATALVVAVFGSTPVGHAVGSAIPAFAKSRRVREAAGERIRPQRHQGVEAATARHARAPRRRRQVPRLVGGLVGPAGPAGPKGDKGASRPRAGRLDRRAPRGPGGPRRCGRPRAGPSGISGWSVPHGGDRRPLGESASRPCTSTARAVRRRSAAASHRDRPSSCTMRVIESAPAGAATGWAATVCNDARSRLTTRSYVWAICASVS